MAFRDSPLRVSWEIQPESADEIEIACVFGTGTGEALPERAAVTMWLSDRPTGMNVSEIVPDGGWQAGDSGAFVSAGPNSRVAIIDVGGAMPMVIGHSGAATWYICVAMADGLARVSPPIVFEE